MCWHNRCAWWEIPKRIYPKGYKYIKRNFKNQIKLGLFFQLNLKDVQSLLKQL